MPKFYGAIDLVKNELQNAVVQNLGTAPSSPSKGQIYFDSTANILYWYNGTAWIAAQSGSSLTPASTVTTSAVADAAVVGTSVNYAREDHKHAREAFGAVTGETVFGVAGNNGVATTVARSDHTHGNPVHDSGAHSAIPISALAAATAIINMGGFRITNLGTPSSNTDAANRQYVDDAVAGLSWKDAVTVRSTANIATLSGLLTIDGVTLTSLDSVLVMNQTTPNQNGIYQVASGAWSRRSDSNTGSEIEGTAVFVMRGTTYAGTSWVLTTQPPITPDTTALTFVQFGAGQAVTAGAGLTLTANQLDLVAGDTSLTVAADDVRVNTTVIATVASVTPKADKTTTVTAGNGLTGGGDLSANRTLDVGAGTGIVVAADTVSIDTAVVPRKYAAALTGTASPEVVTHNLNTRDVHVTVYNGATPYTAVEVDWDATSVNTVTIRYNPNLGAGYRVVVIG